jgi:hypothetical protein
MKLLQLFLALCIIFQLNCWEIEGTINGNTKIVTKKEGKFVMLDQSGNGNPNSEQISELSIKCPEKKKQQRQQQPLSSKSDSPASRKQPEVQTPAEVVGTPKACHLSFFYKHDETIFAGTVNTKEADPDHPDKNAMSDNPEADNANNNSSAHLIVNNAVANSAGNISKPNADPSELIINKVTFKDEEIKLIHAIVNDLILTNNSSNPQKLLNIPPLNISGLAQDPYPQLKNPLNAPVNKSLQETTLPTPKEFKLPTPKEFTLPTPKEFTPPPPKEFTLPTPKEFKLPPPKEFTPPPPKEFTPPSPEEFTPPSPEEFTLPPPKEFTLPPPKEFTPNPKQKKLKKKKF